MRAYASKADRSPTVDGHRPLQQRDGLLKAFQRAIQISLEPVGIAKVVQRLRIRRLTLRVPGRASHQLGRRRRGRAIGLHGSGQLALVLAHVADLL